MVHHEQRKPRVWWRETTELSKKISRISSKKKKADKTKWRNFIGEAAYKENITAHRATPKSPSELVFGILSQHQTISHTTTTATATSTSSCTEKPVTDQLNVEDITVEDDEEETSYKDEATSSSQK